MKNENPEAIETDESKGAIDVLLTVFADIRRDGTASARDDGISSDHKQGASEESGPRGQLGDLLQRLDERAFGLLILILALPCCIPFIYGIPQIVALPMLVLAVQLASGREDPWLPPALANRGFSVDAFENVLTKARRYVGFVEAIARPRLLGVTSPLGARITGLILLAPMASILVPLPSTNTVPGFGVAIAAVGMIERDGLLIILGLLIGLTWVGLLGFLGLEAASILKDLILGG